MNAPAILLGILIAVPAATTAPPRPTAVPKNAPCPPEGDATKARIRALNEKRARDETPSDDDVDETVTMEALVEPGDDSLRWQDGTAVEIVGYVVEVREGGPTTANCHSSNAANHDTILEISPDADVFDPAHRVFAAVTPARRRLMGSNGEDWSTRSLRAQFLHRYVAVTGWLLFDFEAASQALNTAENAGPSIVRATAWEIHPATGIELAEEGESQQALGPHRGVQGEDQSATSPLMATVREADR